MSNQLILSGVQLPAVNISPELAAKVSGQFARAAANVTTSFPRLSFGGKTFNVSFGGDTVELPDRVLDVHLVAVDETFHYTFYEKAFTGAASDKDGVVMSRYPVATDPIDFHPTQEWAHRAYKHRAVVMLADDSEHKLYAVDFGYNSVKKVGNASLGLLNLSQLVSYLTFVNKQNPQLLPFMLTIQLSFTKASVPEVQFSLYDQRQQGNTQARVASPAAINAILNALGSGEVDNLLRIEYDSTASKSEEVTQQPSVAAPVVQPQAVQPQIIQQPKIIQPQVAQQPAHMAQPVVYEEIEGMAAL